MTLTFLSFVKYSLPRKNDDLLISSQLFLHVGHVKKNMVFLKKRIRRNKRNRHLASWKVYRGRTGTFLGSHLVQELSLERLSREMEKDMFEVECAERHRYVYMIDIYIYMCIHRDNAYIYIHMHYVYCMYIN